MVASGKRVCVTFSMMVMLASAGSASAQRPAGQPPTSQPAPGMPTPSTNPNINSAPPAEPVQPVSKQETKAIKTFRDVPANDADKKTQLGEEFIQQYPQSRYRSEVVDWLTTAYLRKGQIDKLQAEGDKELALTPKSPVSLALLGENLARAVNANTPDMQKHLDQAQEYSKKALEVLASATRPAEMSEDKFAAWKNNASAMAYSGLGTVAFRRGKYSDAISNLEQAVKFGGSADPVNYYLLGKANEAGTNFSEALAAYTKCAAIPGGMQAPCQSSVQEMKAHGAVAPN